MTGMKFQIIKNKSQTDRIAFLSWGDAPSLNMSGLQPEHST